MINSELLKEAIADAKAVRATALANAKAALEEAFAPRFEAMFADKLKEESEEEEDQEEGLQEVEAPNQVHGSGGEAKGPATKAVSKGNPKTPKGGAGDVDFKAVQAGLGPTGVPKLGKKVNETAEEEEEEDEGRKKMDETAEEEDEGRREEEGEEEDEGRVEEAGLTSEDLDEIIAELENEVAEEEEGRTEEEPAAPELTPAPEDSGGVSSPVTGDEREPVTGDEEPAANIEAEPGSEVDINLEPEPEAEPGADTVPPTAMDAGGASRRPVREPAEEPVEEPVGAAEDEENINLDELLAALNEEGEEEEEEEGYEEMDEALQNQGLPTKELAGQYKTGGVKGYPPGPDASKRQLPGKNHNIQGKGNIGSGSETGKPMAEASQYRVALKEAYKTIEFLRGQINEVNLLNAKLLYTNKLFKEFAGVLDDSYRMKIVESFDLTKSVREVKLAYALLAESLNFGTQMTKTHSVKSVVKPVSQKGQVKQITEGFASKPVSSTKPSKLITEGNEMALRFKKLAGIKDTPKTTTPEKK
jgi:hypothetical protein